MYSGSNSSFSSHISSVALLPATGTVAQRSAQHGGTGISGAEAEVEAEGSAEAAAAAQAAAAGAAPGREAPTHPTPSPRREPRCAPCRARPSGCRCAWWPQYSCRGGAEESRNTAQSSEAHQAVAYLKAPPPPPPHAPELVKHFVEPLHLGGRAEALATHEDEEGMTSGRDVETRGTNIQGRSARAASASMHPGHQTTGGRHPLCPPPPPHPPTHPHAQPTWENTRCRLPSSA